MAATMVSTIFWGVTPCSLAGVYLVSPQTAMNFDQTTRRHFLEHSTHHSHLRESINCQMKSMDFWNVEYAHPRRP
jgi:hypothetical protein